jgi:hypothetical protein
MKNYTYHFEVMTLIEQFIEALNDIVVKGYDKDLNLIPDSEANVRFVYAPKQRVVQQLTTPGPGGITLPAVAVTLGGLTRDNNRVVNKNDGFYIPYSDPLDPSVVSKKVPQPLPINITVNLSIMAKYQEHLDQILSNFIPYCNPYIIISWKFPVKDPNNNYQELRTEILWSGNANITYPTELAGNAAYRVSADTQFTIKGWLFKSTDEIIKKIYVINEEFFSTRQGTFKPTILEKLNSETVTVSGRPYVLNAFPRYFNFISSNPIEQGLDINLLGKYFIKPENVYLSASSPSMLSGIHLVAPFSAVSKLSAVYPPFYGVKIDSFNYNGESLIDFSLPQVPYETGYLDVIVQNEAGYGKITEGHFVKAGVSTILSGVSGIKFNLY